MKVLNSYAGPTNLCQHSTTDLVRGIMTNERKQSALSKARFFRHSKTTSSFFVEKTRREWEGQLGDETKSNGKALAACMRVCACMSVSVYVSVRVCTLIDVFSDLYYVNHFPASPDERARRGRGWHERLSVGRPPDNGCRSHNPTRGAHPVP